MLTELSLDLKIHICEFLHPSQILALRKTCKTFHEVTSQRIVWIHAVIRICHENSLFLPTFPISDMSDAELERAASAPFRWIALSSSEDRNRDGCLPSRPTQILKNTTELMVNSLQLQLTEDPWWIRTYPYLVPGGRYLVINGPDCLGVWDLGYVSDGNTLDGKPTKMWTVRVDDINFFLVHPTPDGLGIRILTCSSVLHVFEIYPQRDTPELAQIGELGVQVDDMTLNGNRVIIYDYEKGTIIVWDFLANTMAGWSTSGRGFGMDDIIIKATETAVMMFCRHSLDATLWIFRIPPLTTRTSLFGKDLPELAPVLTVECPELISSWCQTPEKWYYGDLSVGSLPLYFDVLREHQKNGFSRYQLDIASDLSNLSLAPIASLSMQQGIGYPGTRNLMVCRISYRICEGRLVNVVSDHQRMVRAYTSSTFESSSTTADFGWSSECHDSSQTPSLHANTTPLVNRSRAYSFCPASGRLAYTSIDGDVIICDFL